MSSRCVPEMATRITCKDPLRQDAERIKEVFDLAVKEEDHARCVMPFCSSGSCTEDRNSAL
jgi:hypothetical protein